MSATRGGLLDALSAGLEWLQNIVFLVVGGWALVSWRRRGDEPSRWLAATFGALAVAVTVGMVTRDMAPSPVLNVVTRLNVLVLLPFPYYLLRFLDGFEPVRRSLRRFVGIGTALSCVLVLAFPSLLVEERQAAPLNRVFTLVVVAIWVVALVTVARRFWQAGRGQPTIVRRRLRTLSLASAALSLAIVFSGAGSGGQPGDALTFAVQLTALLSAGLFLLGFAPPGPVRSHWRQPEERLLQRASQALMSAESPDEVAALLVPHMRDVIAAEAAALVRDGQVLATAGAGAQELRAALAGEDANRVSFPLSGGAIHLWTNRYTPFFGQEEGTLLARLAVLADLALDRTALQASEREARVELEAANAELESFVYSASHDLKSPVIALHSYVDMVTEQYGDRLDDDGRWFLERMRVNCQYMEDLVGDLLELSRVGRVDVQTDRVELGPLVEDLATEVRQQHPGVEVVTGPLPVVRINDVRARQLLRNLLDNAAKHGSPDGVRVEVSARPASELPGGVVVYVRDNGVGVPADYRERVFGVFEQLEARESRASGTGIGLAICRKIVESVGGRIWLTDHADGAEFAILFPPDAVASADSPASIDTEVHA